ncbi:MAG: hypothetical protein H7255_18845 [Ramlibacter sp.]|nr:hypothetical protein [Ramlibacter sp.]
MPAATRIVANVKSVSRDSCKLTLLDTRFLLVPTALSKRIAAHEYGAGVKLDLHGAPQLVVEI